MTMSYLPVTAGTANVLATFTNAPTNDPSPAWLLVAQAADLAQQIAGTEFVPEAMRNNPAAVAACMLYGAEIGIGPMQSLAKIDIVKGRPAPRAELARALALAAGHEVWIPEGEQTNTRCTVKGRRRGTSNVFSTTWTMDDVRKAGIHGHMYAKYPRQMLLARASAELVRMMAPDCLGGIAYFAEELADGGAVDMLELDTSSEPAPASAAPKQPATAAAGESDPAAATPAPPAGATADQPLLPDEEDVGEPPASDAQIKKMMAIFNEPRHHRPRRPTRILRRRRPPRRLQQRASPSPRCPRSSRSAKDASTAHGCSPSSATARSPSPRSTTSCR